MLESEIFLCRIVFFLKEDCRLSGRRCEELTPFLCHFWTSKELGPAASTNYQLQKGCLNILDHFD
jgi:hypothetical protein